MTEWGAALTTAGVIVAAALSLLGVVLNVRAVRERSRAEAAAQDITQRANAQDQLVDQLQEELARYRDSEQEHRARLEDRLTTQDERMNRLQVYADGYRDHAHTLRSHIWDQKPPPPPDWPEGLPR